MIESLNSKVRQAGPGLMLFEHTYNAFSYPKHFHETYLVELIEEGTENFYCNGTNYNNIKSDSLVLINPGEVHTGGGGSKYHNSKLVCQVFYPELTAWDEIMGESNDSYRKLSPPRFKSPIVTDKDIVANIKKIYSLNARPECALLQKELYHTVMFDLLTRHMSSSIIFDENLQRYASAIERGKEYINDNLSDKLILEDIARAAYISPFHFLRIFKSIMGITIHQYVLSLRVERAKNLLVQTGSIRDAFSHVGFLNQVHFTKVFRKITGYTPLQFRKIVCD